MSATRGVCGYFHAVGSVCMKCGWFDESKAGAEIARLRARLAEVEGAARALVDHYDSGAMAGFGAKYDALRAVLSRTEGRTPEVKP